MRRMTPVGVFLICPNEDKCHFVNSALFITNCMNQPLPSWCSGECRYACADKKRKRIVL